VSRKAGIAGGGRGEERARGFKDLARHDPDLFPVMGQVRHELNHELRNGTGHEM
jgi:hypothetical protein